MAQYSSYSVSVTNNSNVVIGTSTLFLSKVQVGNAFKVKGDLVIYTISAVISDTEIHLSASYMGATNATAQYQITTDFTPVLGLTEVNAGDQDWATHLTQGVIRKLDTMVAPNLLTGYTSTTGTVAATDTVLQAIGKLNGNIDTKAALAGSSAQDFAVKALSASGVSSVIGNSSNAYTPQLFVGDSISQTTGKQLWLGYNTTADYGYLQAAHNGTGYTALAVNSLGGNVLIGATLDTGEKLQVNGSASFAGAITGNTVYQKLSVTPAGAWSANTLFTQYETFNIARTYLCGNDASSRGTWEIYTATSTGSPENVLAVSSTGLAVTGKVTSTGDNPAFILANDNYGFKLVNATGRMSYYSNAINALEVDVTGKVYANQGLAVTGGISATVAATAAGITLKAVTGDLVSLTPLGTGQGGVLGAADATGANYAPLELRGTTTTVKTGSSATTTAVFSSTGLAVTGGVSASGNAYVMSALTTSLSACYQTYTNSAGSAGLWSSGNDLVLGSNGTTERVRVSSAGLAVTGGITATGAVVASGGLTIMTATVGPTQTGNIGTVVVDDNYIYVCTATNTWKRVALTTY